MLRIPKKLTADTNADLGNRVADAQDALKKIAALDKGFNGVEQNVARAAWALQNIAVYVAAAQAKFDAEPDAKTAADLGAPDVIAG